MQFIDYYLLAGLLVHVALLGLVDWLGYNHLVKHGYDHSLLFLALLNIAVCLGLYYLVLRPLRQRVHLRRLVREARRQRVP
jgi:hypothetical protein